mgnify:CR=1 FL=1
MANVAIREAVKVYHVALPTLTLALKDGTVSGVKDGKALPAKLTTLYTPENSEVEQRKSALAVAEARADAAETLAKERADRIEDLRRMLPPPDAPKTKVWRWPWQK